MIVCLCHRVSDRDIARAVAAGCQSFDELQEHSRVATACGACLECAQETYLEQGGGCGHCAGAALCGGAPVWAAA